VTIGEITFEQIEPLARQPNLDPPLRHRRLSGEFFWNVRNQYNTFFKGLVGGGGLTGAISTTRITSPAR
jgi:hypothetical protein